MAIGRYHKDADIRQILTVSTNLDNVNNFYVIVVDSLSQQVKKMSLNPETGFIDADTTKIDSYTIEVRIHRDETTAWEYGRFHFLLMALNDDTDFTDAVRVDSNSVVIFRIVHDTVPTFENINVSGNLPSIPYGEFKSLDDTPVSYLGSGGKTVNVNTSEDGLDFVDLDVYGKVVIDGKVDAVQFNLDTHIDEETKHLSNDQNDALDGAASPSSTNAIATMDDVDAKKDNFTENTAFNKNFGNTPGTVVEGGHEHNLAQIIHVALSGGDFTTVRAALDSITDNSGSNQYVILVAAGNYMENNPLPCKEFVSIKSMGGSFVTSLIATNASQNMFDMSAFCVIRGINVYGVTGANSWAFNQLVGGNSSIIDCITYSCSNGILINHIDAAVNITNGGEYNVIGTTDKVLSVLSGNVSVNGLKCSDTSSVDTLIEINGVNANAVLQSIESKSPNLINGLVIKNGAHVGGSAIVLKYLYDGIILEGNDTNARLDVVKVMEAQNNGFQINNVGTGIKLSLFATTISQAGNLNFNVLNPNCIVTGNGFTEINSSYIVPGAKFYTYLLDVTEDDEGLNIFGELHVGAPTNPTESVFGEGDSYTRGMKVYTWNGTTFNDVSTAAASASGSNFAFPNATTDTALYITSTLADATDYLQHFGIKSKIITAAVLGTGNIVAEYWNGSAWAVVNVSEMESSSHYYPKADNIFQTAGSAHIRYNSEMTNDSWVKNDPMTIGTDYFWVRYRITADISTAPVFEQWKLHSNRFEINGDGWVEYFGKARPIGQLPLSLAFGKPFEGNMQNQTLYTSQDIGVGGTANKFTSTTDKLGANGFLPFDLDTSSPLRLTWSGHGAVAGTYGWTIRWAWVTNGDTLTYGEPGAAITNSDSTVISKTLIIDEVTIFEALLDVSKLLARRSNAFGDELWISLQPTTLPGNFTLGGSQVTYTKWSEGGHI